MNVFSFSFVIAYSLPLTFTNHHNEAATELDFFFFWVQIIAFSLHHAK